MKKFLIVSLVILFAAAVLPQTAAAGVGVKGGYAWSNLRFAGGTDLPTTTDIKNLVGGVYFSIGLGLFSIQPEVLYVRQGGRMEALPDWDEYRLDYIQVPVLLKIHVIPGPISPMIYGGPYGAYRLSAKGVSFFDGELEPAVDIKNRIKSTDYGLVFGGGIDFRLPVIKLSAEVRYNLGLANIAKGLDPGMSVKNKSLMVLVGIGF
ncbi:MAG: porin family protein [Candidatus Aminicenantales bacterium]